MNTLISTMEFLIDVVMPGATSHGSYIPHTPYDTNLIFLIIIIGCAVCCTSILALVLLFVLINKKK